MGNVQGAGQYEDVNSEGRLEGGADRYALHRLCGPMKASLGAGLATLPAGCRHQASAELPYPSV